MPDDNFGTAIALSRDGSVLTVGANYMNDKQEKVRIFSYVEEQWTQFGDPTTSESFSGVGGNQFGSEVATSRDGMIVTVGAVNRAPSASLKLSETVHGVCLIIILKLVNASTFMVHNLIKIIYV